MQALLRIFGISPEFNPALNRFFYLYQNVDNVYTSGIESKIELKLTRNLMISTGYTYLDARDKDHRRLPQRAAPPPRELPNLLQL